MRAVKSLDFAKCPVNSLLAGNLTGDRRDQHCIASQAVRPSCRYSEGCEKGPPTAGFCIWPPVSRLPFRLFGGPNRRKSPAGFENIPVFRRLRPETWFERHCPVRAAVIGANLSAALFWLF